MGKPAELLTVAFLIGGALFGIMGSVVFPPGIWLLNNKKLRWNQITLPSIGAYFISSNFVGLFWKVYTLSLKINFSTEKINVFFLLPEPAVALFRKKAQISIHCRYLLIWMRSYFCKWLPWMMASHEPSSIKYTCVVSQYKLLSDFYNSLVPHNQCVLLCIVALVFSFLFTLFSLIWGVHWFIEQTKAALFYNHMCQISPWHPCIFIGKQQHKSPCSCIRTLLKKQLPTVSFWGGKNPFYVRTVNSPQGARPIFHIMLLTGLGACLRRASCLSEKSSWRNNTATSLEPKRQIRLCENSCSLREDHVKTLVRNSSYLCFTGQSPPTGPDL